MVLPWGLIDWDIWSINICFMLNEWLQRRENSVLPLVKDLGSVGKMGKREKDGAHWPAVLMFCCKRTRLSFQEEQIKAQILQGYVSKYWPHVKLTQLGCPFSCPHDSLGMSQGLLGHSYCRHCSMLQSRMYICRRPLIFHLDTEFQFPFPHPTSPTSSCHGEWFCQLPFLEPHLSFISSFLIIYTQPLEEKEEWEAQLSAACMFTGLKDVIVAGFISES